MENVIKKGDEQLVLIYKIYREQQEPSYAHKSEIFETYGTSLAEIINEQKDNFDSIYRPHINNGYLVLLDSEGNVVRSGNIGGDISINITDVGVGYIEATYPFLV